MIRAKDILEAYKTRLPYNFQDGSFEVFENPSLKELRSADSTGLGIRFSADKTSNTVYAWDVDATIHDLVHRRIGVKGRGKQVSIGWTSLLTGMAEQQGGKYVMVGSDLLDPTDTSLTRSEILDILRMLSDDWSWVDVYIKVTPYLRELERGFERLG
jgi:hypothetical protein